MNTNKIKLDIGLKFGLIHNKSMIVKYKCQDNEQIIVPNADNFGSLQTDIDLPCFINLEFSNKDMNNDTVVSDGVVVADLYVEITNLSIDGFEAPQDYIKRELVLQLCDGNIIKTSYIGFNGKMQIDLSKLTVFSQVMDWKKRLTSND